MFGTFSGTDFTSFAPIIEIVATHLLGDENVGGFEISVDDLVAVDVEEPVQHLLQDLAGETNKVLGFYYLILCFLCLLCRQGIHQSALTTQIKMKECKKSKA